MADVGEADSTPCPLCGSTRATVTFEVTEPVVIDKEVMVVCTVISAECKLCSSTINIGDGHMFTMIGEKADDDDETV